MSQGLYYLSTTITPIACSAVVSLHVVHQCLGHLCLQRLHCMVSTLSEVSTLECESRQFEKHNKSLFPVRVNKGVTSPFALVHFDIEP